MPNRAVSVWVLVLAFVVTCGAQRSSTSMLVLEIPPEAVLDPQQMNLNFVVSPDGSSDVTVHSATVAAKVRTLPGRQIHVMGRLVGFQGPEGPVASNALRWSGLASRATGGGVAASCSSGTFQADAQHDLVLGWQRSGILTCAVTFELAEPRNLSPGSYSGRVELALDIR